MIRGRNTEIKYPSMVNLRRRWKIPSVEMLKTIALANISWKNRLKYREIEEKQLSKVGSITRNVKSLRITVSLGLNDLSAEAPCRKMRNAIPDRIKNEENKTKIVSNDKILGTTEMSNQ